MYQTKVFCHARDAFLEDGGLQKDKINHRHGLENFLLTFVQECHDNVGLIDGDMVGIAQVYLVVLQISLCSLLFIITIFGCLQFLVDVQ